MRRLFAIRMVALSFLCRRRPTTQGAGRASIAASLQHEVGDQAITVAAIDGADELDDPP